MSNVFHIIVVNLSILEAMMSFFIHIIAWMLCIGAFVFFLGVIFLVFSPIWNLIIAIVSLFCPKAKKLHFDFYKYMGPLRPSSRY